MRSCVNPKTPQLTCCLGMTLNNKSKLTLKQINRVLRLPGVETSVVTVVTVVTLAVDVVHGVEVVSEAVEVVDLSNRTVIIF